MEVCKKKHRLKSTDFSGEPSSIHAVGAIPFPDEKGQMKRAQMESAQ